MIFFVEDEPHRALLRCLKIPRRSIRVAGARGNVIKKLRDSPGDVGIVDEDPRSTQTQSHEFNNYLVTKTGEGLQLRARRGSGGQRLIVLCPRVEDWLIDRAGACQIDLKQYCLPSTTKELKDRPRYAEKEWFLRFLDELRDRDIGLLRQWVSQGRS
jgi:hypothetical protein